MQKLDKKKNVIEFTICQKNSLNQVLNFFTKKYWNKLVTLHLELDLSHCSSVKKPHQFDILLGVNLLWD